MLRAGPEVAEARTVRCAWILASAACWAAAAWAASCWPDQRLDLPLHLVQRSLLLLGLRVAAAWALCAAAKRRPRPAGAGAWSLSDLGGQLGLRGVEVVDRHRHVALGHLVEFLAGDQRLLVRRRTSGFCAAASPVAHEGVQRGLA